MATVGSRSGQVTVRVGEDPRIDDESQPEDGKVGNGKHGQIRQILDRLLNLHYTVTIIIVTRQLIIILAYSVAYKYYLYCQQVSRTTVGIRKSSGSEYVVTNVISNHSLLLDYRRFCCC